MSKRDRAEVIEYLSESSCFFKDATSITVTREGVMAMVRLAGGFHSTLMMFKQFERDGECKQTPATCELQAS